MQVYNKIFVFQRNTVSRWVKRFEEEGSLQCRVRSGRPPLINPTQRRAMVEEYEINGFIPTKIFADQFDTSVRTVRRALHAEGLHHRKPAKKPFLTQKHKEERLRFAREYLDFNWDTTIFTDEKTFKSCQKGRLHLWRKDNTRWSEQNIIPNTESGRISVNMWGWISAQGPGELEFIPTRANSSNYVSVLNDIMLPTVRNVYPIGECSELNFVQDNCPIHRASIVKEWFSKHSDIKVIPWPARSPDLNPIENIWGLMVQRWEARDERCPEQLKFHCTQLWENLRGTDICANIVASMRRRLLSCIENNGGHTKY